MLLAADGTPRLADFGMAHFAAASQLTQTGMLMGTVDYLSPEACQGEPIDERADIWAFGVLLFEMLSGQPPFGGDNLTARLTAILMQPTPDLAALVPSLPDGLLDLIYRMLEKDRQLRIPSMRQVGPSWRRCSRATWRPPRHPSGAARIVSPRPRRRQRPGATTCPPRPPRSLAARLSCAISPDCSMTQTSVW